MTDPNAPPRPSPARARSRPLLTDLSAARWLLLAILAAAVYFFHTFLVPVLAAGVIAVASWPIRQRLVHQMGIGRTIGATILVVILVLFLVIPIIMALSYAFRELQSWISWGILVNSVGAPTPAWISNLPSVGDWLDLQWKNHIGRPGAIADHVHFISGENIGTIYRAALTTGSLAVHLVLNLVFLLITLFVLYRDGDRLVAQVDIVGSRILHNRWQRLSRIVPTTISATVTGMTLIAIGEGVILGLAYWVAGVPSPVTFAVITGFMALIPGGAPLSFTLVSLYLVASGSTVEGIALFVWGTVELFIVDKTIRPVLVGGPVRLPFLPTFFGLVGGVKTMGIVGLFVGPVIMAILVAMWREWQRELIEHPVALPPEDLPPDLPRAPG